MRSFIIVTVLSALAASYNASVLPDAEQMPSNFIYTVYDGNSPNGTIVSLNDITIKSSFLLSTWRNNVQPIPGEEQRIEMKYEGLPGDRITTIMVGHSTTPTNIYHSPLFDYFIDMQIVSHRGQGIDIYVAIYGR